MLYHGSELDTFKIGNTVVLIKGVYDNDNLLPNHVPLL